MVSRLSVTVDYDDFKDRQLVVEAVPEDWDLKVTSLRGIEERLAGDASWRPTRHPCPSTGWPAS